MSKEKEMEAIYTMVRSLDDKMKELKQTMNEGFTEVNERLDRIEKKILDGNKLH
ncbi:hypothetical protein [Cytobacillus firmus]|uniref:hypothetical protein n=1 Tax=Cytobacillus firmus TaxID=1399 RepID=UPI001CFE1936|nr:hypothetical protein [Cytobacillus firmus]